LKIILYYHKYVAILLTSNGSSVNLRSRDFKLHGFGSLPRQVYRDSEVVYCFSLRSNSTL